MRKVMVVRAGRGIGRALIERLIRTEIEVVAYSGSARKLEELRGTYPSETRLRTVRGDAGNAEELAAAAEGTDVILCGVYLTYDEKPAKARRMLQAVRLAAARTGARVVVLEGVYRPADEDGFAAELARDPRVLLLEVPELYGADAANTLTHYALRKLMQGKPVKRLVDPDVRREYLYADDAARYAAELASDEAAFGKRWRLQGGPPLSGAELLGLAGALAGKPVRFERVGGWKLRLLKWAEPRAKELLERYDDGERVPGPDDRVYVGASPCPYEAGLARTLERLPR